MKSPAGRNHSNKDDSSSVEEEFIVQSVEIGQDGDEFISESGAEDSNHRDESTVVIKEASDVDEETPAGESSPEVKLLMIEDYCDDAIR